MQSVNPDAGEPLPNVIGVRPADGVSDAELVENINAQSLELDALTRTTPRTRRRASSQVQQSFTIIFLLYGLVVPCVTGLFFLIVTFQKAGALTLLRAIGAPAGRLVASLLIQVADHPRRRHRRSGRCSTTRSRQQTLGGLPLRFETRRSSFWSVLLIALGVASSLIAARRVLRSTRSNATTGGEVGR